MHRSPEPYSEDRILVGAVSVSALLAEPSIGPLMMFDASSGAKVWEAQRQGGSSRPNTLSWAVRPFILVQALAPKVLHLSVIDPETGRSAGNVSSCSLRGSWWTRSTPASWWLHWRQRAGRWRPSRWR